MPHDSTDGDLLITDDRSLLDVDVIHDVLKQTYWSGNIPRDLLVRAIDNSIPVGLYRAGERWGSLARLPNRATFAYLADVFI